MKIGFRFDKSLFRHTSSLGTLSVWALFLPMAFETIMLNLQSTVNTAVLSTYSEVSVSAVGATATVIGVLSLLGSAVATGAITTISNRIGAEKLTEAKELSFTAIITNIITGSIISPIMVLLAPTVVSLLNLTGEIYKEAVIYLQIRMAFLIFTYVTTAVLALLKCYGYAKYTFVVGFSTNMLNLIFNIIVVYFPKYSPVTGVAGVALDAGLSNVIGLLIAIAFLIKVKIKLAIPKISVLFRHLKDIVSIGVPAGISAGSFTFSMVIATSFIALLGDTAISSNVYYNAILGYVHLFSYNLGVANAILVGRCFGAGDYEKADRMNAQLIKITRVVNLTLSLSILIFSRPLLSIFTDNEWTFTVAIGVFAVDILAEQSRAVSHVYEAALRSVGDVVFPMAFLIVSCFSLSIGLAYFLAIVCDFGLIGYFIGVSLDETTRALVTYFRWKSGKWKIKKLA